MADTLPGPEHAPEEHAPDEHAPDDGTTEALDTYSRIVATVAAAVTPRVAALQVPRRGRGGWFSTALGSAVVFTEDGFLLTNAHVVGHADAGTLAFADGTTSPFHTIGADPLSDLAVLRADGPTPTPVRLGEATGLRVGSWSSPSAIRSDSPAPSPPAWSARSAARCPPAPAAPYASSTT